MWFTRTNNGFRGWFQAIKSNGELRTGAPSGSFQVDIIDFLDVNSIQTSISESSNVPGNYYFDIPSSFLVASGSGDYAVSVQINVATSPKVIDAFGKVLHITEQDWDSLSGSVSTNFDDLRDTTIAAIEYQRAAHSAETYVFVDPVSGSDANTGNLRRTAKKTIGNALSSITEEHTAIIVLGSAGNQQIISENITMDKRFTFLRGPGLDVQLIGSVDSSPTINVVAEGCEIAGFEIATLGTGTPDAIQINADFCRLRRVRIVNPRRHGIFCLDSDRTRIDEAIIEGAGQSGSGNGILLSGSSFAIIDTKSTITDGLDDNILIDPGAGVASNNIIDDCTITNSQGFGINILSGSERTKLSSLAFTENVLGDIQNLGSGTVTWGTVLDNYNGAIYIDPASSFSGLSYPVGTEDFPVNNISDARALAISLGIKQIVIVNGTITLTQSMVKYKFKGLVESTIDPNGVNINGSLFEDILISGTMNGSVDVKRGGLENVEEFKGTAQQTSWFGSIGLASGKSTFHQCYSKQPGTGTPTLDFVGGGRTANVRGYDGGITIANMSTGGNIATLDFDSGQVIVDSSCTAGTLVIRGIAAVTDNSAGTAINVETALSRTPIAEVVWDQASNLHLTSGTMGWLQNQIVDTLVSGTGGNISSSSIDNIVNAIWDEILPGEHDTSGSAGKLLQTAGTGGVDTDLLAGAVWNRDPSLHLTTGTMGWIQNQELITSQSVDKIRAMTCGRWILSGSQMIFYDDDNVTEVTRFNLLDTEGDPFFSEANAPAERIVTGSA